MKFIFPVTVETDSDEHAQQVLNERLGHDEDYGFEYTLDYTAPAIRPGVDAVNEQLDGEGSIKGLFDTLEHFGAGVLKLTSMDENDNPLRLIIAVDGAEESKEIYDAVEAIQAAWDEEKDEAVRTEQS